MRVVCPAVLALLLTGPAVAGPSTSAVSDYMGVFIETTVSQYRMLCAARQPDTADAWRDGVQAWRNANAAALRDLQAIANGLEAASRNRAFDTGSKQGLADRAAHLTAFTSFMMLSATQPAIELARSNDAQARERCKGWFEAIAVNGPLQAGMPAAVAGAKRLLAAELEPRR